MNNLRRIFLTGTVSAFLSTAAAPGVQAADAGAHTNRISGVVTDAAGRPVAGATVEYWRYPGIFTRAAEATLQKTFRTGADGVFELQTSADYGVLVAQKNGLAPEWRQIGEPFGRGRATENNLMLTTPGTLAGVVVDESNRPAANAEVYVPVAISETSLANGSRTYQYLAGQVAHNLFSARTDAAGHFVIGNFPTNASASFAVQLPGRVIRPEESDFANGPMTGHHAGDEDIKLTVQPAGSVEGKVVVAEANQPLPAARLRLQPDQPVRSLMARNGSIEADAHGSFHFYDVAAGGYRIYANFGTNASSEWVADSVPVNLEPGQSVRGVQVMAVRGALLEVTVRENDSHKPVANVNVSAYRQNNQAFAVSEDDGVARLRLLPGEYQIAANRNSTASAQSTATVETGVTNRLELEVAGPKKISGIVRGPDGRPAAGLPVQLIGGYGPGTSEIKTDADGKFELDWNPRQFAGQENATVCVLVRDTDKDLAAAEDVDEDTGALDLKLASGLTFVGRAECDGKAITNATGTLVFWSGNRGMWLQGLTRTNTAGQYEIPALPPGRKYGVVVSAPGYGQKQLFNFEVQGDPGRQELDVAELKPANLKLAGQVLDAEDKPVAGCFVNLNGEDQPNGNVRTDREGRFVFERVCEGTVRLSANGGGGFGNISAEGGDTNVVLRLGQNVGYAAGAQMHKLSGVITDPEGKPDPDAQLAIFPQSGETHWSKANPDGHYHLTWSLQPWQLQNSGGARLMVRDLARDLATVEELSEDATNLDAKLQPAVTLTGQVKNAGGTPMPGAEISVLFKVGTTFDTLDARTKPTDAAGRYEIKCLPADGQYIVSASAKGYGRSQQNVEPEAETNRVELSLLELKLADKVIAGQVLKGDDKPASGVNVNLSGDGQPSGTMTTDSQGRFHFQVCEGRIQLFAYSQYGAGNGQAVAEAGDTNIVMNLASQPGMVRETVRHASLKGSPLPDLTTVDLAADAAPVGKPVLLCLFDAGQRPSRHAVQVLDQQAAALRQRNVSVVSVQATVTTDETFNDWKTASPISFPVGRVTGKSQRCDWASNVSALPWLVLTDADHKVIAEGFSLDELDAQLQKVSK